MARRKQKKVEVDQGAHVTALHPARSNGNSFGKRRFAKPAKWPRRKSLGFILGSSLILWAVIIAAVYIISAVQ